MGKVTLNSLPLLPDVGVIALVPDVWSPHWQPRHQVLSRLARYFHVVWMNPPLDWREVFRARWAYHVPDPSGGHSPGFVVSGPDFWLPRFYRPAFLARLTFRQRLKRARNILTARGCRRVILYLWRPEFAPALQLVCHDLSCYHIDDEYSFSEIETAPNEAEVHLIKTVDQVFISSEALIEKKGTLNPNTFSIPNGVDYDGYATEHAEPSDLAAIPRPLIGYSGVLKKQLDWALLLQLTQRQPDWSFVFVGPQQASHPEIVDPIRQLSLRANVHFLGDKSVDALAAYAQHYDVCIMPYRVNDYTRYIYPLKLHEYLASGRPVVGSRIHSLEKFPHLVALATGVDEWTEAVADALHPAANTEARRAARQASARRHDWRSLVEGVAKTMAQGLGEQFAERLAGCLDTSRTKCDAPAGRANTIDRSLCDPDS